MQRITRRALLAMGAAGLSTVACAESSPFGLRRPRPTAAVALATAVATIGPAETPVPIGLSADGYLAVAPSTLHPGQHETLSFSLFRGDQPADGDVTASLLKDNQTLASVSARVNGHGAALLAVPSLPDGDYQLQVDAAGARDRTSIRVDSEALVFLETDKPIYKPGQTVHFRLLGLTPALTPASGAATIEVLDAKGIKVFKASPAIDETGMASVDLPLSDEPNLGVWKATATLGSREAELDVRVETYVLPKYEVTVDLARDWALASDPIDGTVSARYSYGKAVSGDVEISALRYVGTWQEYARVTRAIDGQASFTIPPVRYAVGTPGAGGSSNVRLDVTVREQSTGYEQRTSELVTVAASPVIVQVISESTTFKPSLPLNLLVVVQTPDRKPVDATVQMSITYQDASYRPASVEQRSVATTNGLATLAVTPPTNAATARVLATANGASAPPLTLRAGYSPTGSFIHVEQSTAGPLKVGDSARFKISATNGGTDFYYEVVARGQVILSEVTRGTDLTIVLTPAMAPESRLLVYQVLPSAEVAADYLPVKVAGDYPQAVQLSVDRTEVKPGDSVNVSVQTEGPARVGLVAVDRSVFILAENRLNLQQVFDELEQLYLKPQVELHDVQPIAAYGPVTLPGAKETFQDAGVVVLTNRQIPNGKTIQPPLPMPMARALAAAPGAELKATAAPRAATDQSAPVQSTPTSTSLASVQRVRQFFPETWLWDDLTTDSIGHFARNVVAPDSITTWMLRAVALSKDKGLGIAETQLRVFQPFFLQLDLPYSAIRGEELPAKVALYNYQNTAQQFVVELEPGGWFDLVDVRSKTVSVEPNGVGGVSFTIRPTGLGPGSLKVIARSQSAADAIVKDLLVEPEGIPREVVENLTLSAGGSRTLDLTMPAAAVEGSARAFLALTGSVLSQTIQGLDGLLQMPFGCGEQNMINFAPDVFITRYLQGTGQAKPETMAKANLLMLTGYQRELTYRRDDGSFSAFGNSDSRGSLFLTAFVLETFARARDLIAIDDGVLSAATSWIQSHQNADGSFDPFGFMHHQDLLGGVNGKTALTAYVAIALEAAGAGGAATRAVRYLEGVLDTTDDAYGLATTAYALALAKSARAPAAHDKLMTKAQQSPDGLWWGANGEGQGVRPRPVPTAAVETTAYAALALLQIGDNPNAGRTTRWLSAQRNSSGGFGSTQDTVVALQAMTTAATSSRADTNLAVTIRSGTWEKAVRIGADNADVLQLLDVPLGRSVTIAAGGKGELIAQTVRRFNLPTANPSSQSAFQIDVRYGTDQVAVNDQIAIDASIKFTPPEPIAAGMVVLDVAVPTGFEPVAESLVAMVKAQPKLKRYDVAGRKIILYIEDMLPDEELSVSFQARALYPVRAKAVSSQVYSYYRPDWKGETIGGAVVVRG